MVSDSSPSDFDVPKVLAYLASMGFAYMGVHQNSYSSIIIHIYDQFKLHVDMSEKKMWLEIKRSKTKSLLHSITYSVVEGQFILSAESRSIIANMSQHVEVQVLLRMAKRHRDYLHQKARQANMSLQKYCLTKLLPQLDIE